MEDEEGGICALARGKFKKFKFWKYPQDKPPRENFRETTLAT